ncbi:MAG: GNAT family N-acetyltransferase [Clostridia bacterium]|nr:GNAT family N-acetyltransferase [Clostridia bacterium]
MSKLFLKPANIEDAEKEWRFVAAMPANENGLTNKWHGVSHEKFISEVLPRMINNSKGIDLPEGFVPDTTLFLWNETEIVGQFRLRHYLPETKIPGHIGYYIAKEHRGKGFATEGLRLTLAYGAGIIPEDEFYMRLNKDNPASLCVMLKNGGRIVGETEDKLIVKIPKVGCPVSQIKQISPDDYPACAAAFGGGCSFAETCLAQQQAGNREAYALFVNGEIAAECHLVYDNPDYGTVPGRRLYFSRLIVKKGERGKGYGEALSRALLDIAKEKGYREIALGVNRDNTAAVRLYRKLGFTVYEEAADADGEFYRMEKLL